MSKNDPNLIQAAVNTIRFLAVDGVEKANSGHPGLPMGMADCAFVLFDKFLRHDPSQPDWPGRDRFILSAGHGSMLLYAMLHLTGYDLSLEELQNFRQWDSKTPGHPEYGLTPGVETTTGPLGQGFANGVGMALAGRMLSARFATADFDPADWRVFGLVSDGDLMEGVAAEAASLAGHLGLSNLVYLYDDNRISIEGSTQLTFTEDVAGRFAAYGWHVQQIDGHDRQAIDKALEVACQQDKPAIICARTHIAYGSPNKQDSESSHGAPLGGDEVHLTKKNLGWPEEPSFHVPDEVRRLFEAKQKEHRANREKWDTQFATFKQQHPDKAALWEKHTKPSIRDDLLEELIPSVTDQALATRALSGKVLNKAAELYPSLFGGSADLAPSNKTMLANQAAICADDFAGRNIHFGVREHAMGSVMNGMALSGAFIPYGGTFLVFADYMRPPMRLAALMGLGTIYVFTHDSIFVGEDGPTHQPIEQLGSLRCMPNLTVVRPADGLETAAAWTIALMRRNAPTALILTRQKLPQLERPAAFQPKDMLRGAYTLVENKPGVKAVVIATGSEVAHAAQAAQETGARCVSMLSAELFLDQPQEYRDQLLPPDFRTAVVEASHDHSWYRFVDKQGLVIGMERYGASAPGAELGRQFGFTQEGITEKIKAWLA